jgi:signal transduction histidine kinase/ActR/RegA family two-component response regulator
VRSFLRRLPIRLKLVAMILIVAAVVLALASGGYLINDYVQARRDIEHDLTLQAELILKNTDTALEFDDARTAAETLSTLALLPSVRLGCLYRADDTLFGGYHAAGETDPCPATAATHGSRFGRNQLEVSRVGLLEGRKYGSVLLRSDLAELTQRARVQLGIVALLLGVAIVVAVILSSRLQTIVSEPVRTLANTAGEVTQRGDYSLRATRTTDDELGVLVDGFNRMLDRIQERDSALSRANEELRKEIAERRRAEQERAEMLVREREANRLKDEFLATLSHELRTPLNAILGWVKLLRTNAVPTQSIDRALEKVERNAQVQSRLIEDLLEVSRIVSGKLRLEFRPFDLAALCATAIDAIRPTSEARGVAIHRDFQAPSLLTAGDPDRLQQVIWNLLSNAVKFTPAGGSVKLTLRRTGRIDEIVVSDTGIGIDPAFLPSVFETFRQADASSTRAHGGLGLGLSIVKQLVDLHGGEVTAFSAGKDKGATFSVRLPVRTAEGRRADDTALARNRPVTGRLAGRSVLVVDDDADTRELLVSVLSHAGARVRAAASVREAVDLCLGDAPDAVISDIAMPGEDGYALMREMRDRLRNRVPRVRIALSAFAGARDRERTLAAGFQHHLAKPIDPEVLVGLLDDLLGDAMEASG